MTNVMWGPDPDPGSQSDDDGVDRDGCSWLFAWLLVVVIWAGIVLAHLLA